MRESKGEKIFYICNSIFLIIITALILYPVVYVISSSFSSGDAIRAERVTLLPVDFDLTAYKYVLADKQIWISYLNSFFYTIAGTVVSMILTISGAYPLSKDELPGKKVLTFFVVLTLWFTAGMIPTYLNFRDLKLVNTRTVIIIGHAVATYNFVLMRNFFASIPKSLEEAADIDGAKQFQILCKIYLPLSLPSLATIGLFYAVARWNEYLWPMILLSDDKKIPLQVVVKKMIVDLKASAEDLQNDELFRTITDEGIVYASIVVSAVPMLVIYPLVQRFFVKGIMVGAVKG